VTGRVLGLQKALPQHRSWLTMTAWWQHAISKSGTLSLSQDTGGMLPWHKWSLVMGQEQERKTCIIFRAVQRLKFLIAINLTIKKINLS